MTDVTLDSIGKTKCPGCQAHLDAQVYLWPLRAFALQVMCASCCILLRLYRGGKGIS